MYFLYSSFSKSNTKQCEMHTEWPEKLQPAVLEANTQFKRSTFFTPFRHTQNTCQLGNILQSKVFNENTLAICDIFGTTPSEARLLTLMSLVDEFDFNKLLTLLPKSWECKLSSRRCRTQRI